MFIVGEARSNVGEVTPLQEYEVRKARWEQERDLRQAAFIRIGNWRLAVGIIAAVLAWLILVSHVLRAYWILVPIAVFIMLAVRHSRVIRARTLADRGIAYYQRGVARLNDTWVGSGNPGDQFNHPDHLYAADLDIFGKGGLFELVSTTRTEAGDEALASWLLNPAPETEVTARQDAIHELGSRLDFREDLALLGEDIRARVNAAKLNKWGAAPALSLRLSYLRPLAIILSLGGVTAVIGFFAQLLPIWFFAGVLAIGLLFRYSVRKPISSIVSGVEANGSDLLLLSVLLARLERERFQSPLLVALSSDIRTTGRPASQRLSRLKRWIELLESSEHMIIRVIRPFLLWEEQAAMGIESWRRESGADVGKWIGAIATFEAISSLANLAYERPDWRFPEFDDSAAPEFAARAIRHPLLPRARAVANDVTLGAGTRLLIVSGSNMSGKSTLLRAIGLNCVLAWAGAPVAADNLRLSRLHVAASIRVVDSLQDNRSRFYTEITRIRNIVALANSGAPVLFLLDELLSGTNSHDRVIGAAAILRSLVSSSAIGLITTHDLALANIEREFGPGVCNVHFEDSLEGGEMHFDYRLKPGVVKRSNALELMRAVGLEV
jgi:hypothetical protein